MKKSIKIFLLGVIAALSMTSCDDPIYPNPEGGEGVETGSLQAASLQLVVLNSEEILQDRAGVDVSNFTVNILNNAGEKIKSWAYSQMPSIIPLNVGHYTLEVYNAECQDAAWDAPYYYAAKEFDIAKNDVTDIGELVCKLANVKVSIKYTDQLAALLGSDVVVNVVVGDQFSLDFAGNETRAGFFRCLSNSSTLVATFTGSVNGTKIEDFKIISDVAPGQHRIITFALKEGPIIPNESGNLDGKGISLDFNVSKVDLTVDNPVTEDPVEPDDMLELSASARDFTNLAATKTVDVTATGDWTATSNAAWCVVTPATGAKGKATVSIQVEENQSTDAARNAVVTFRMGDIETSLTVAQAPKPDETAPKITSETINLNGVNVYTDGLLVKVNISAPNSIAHLYVTIDSETLTPAELESVELCDQFDLVDPQYPSTSPYYGNPEYVLSDKLGNLGFPIKDGVLGQTNLDFDITSFMPMLQALGSGQSNFLLQVVDAKGQIVEGAIRVKFE